MGDRRSRLASSSPPPLLTVFWAASIACVQLDGDAAALGDARLWGEADRIHQQGVSIDIALDSDGNAVMAWRERRLNLRDWEIWSNTYTPSGGWSTALRIDENPMGELGTPAIAVDREGNAVVVFDQPDGTRFDLWSVRYTPSDGWDAPQRIETNDAGDTFRPQVAMDPSGTAVAVWQQSDGTRDNIWANRYTPDDGWGIFAERIDASNSANGAQGPQVDMDADGNAIAVWQQSDGTRHNIWANRYASSGGWGVAEPIEFDDAGGASAPQIATDPNGNAVAVWQQSDGTRENIWANRYTPPSGWGAAQRIEANDAGNALHPQVAVDANGKAVAVWDQFDGVSFDVWANHYTPAGRWGTARRIEANDTGEALRPQVAMNLDGNAVVVWEQRDGEFDTVWANRYTLNDGWSSAQRIDGHTDHVQKPRVVVAPNGMAMAVWSVVIGWSQPNHGIWENRLE